MSKNYHTENKTFMVYKDWEEYMKMLSDDEAGKLFRALFSFAVRGEEAELGGIMRVLFIMMRNTLERDGKKWEKTCEARELAKAAKNSRSADKEKDTDTDKDKDTGIDTEKEPRAEGRKASASRNNSGKNSNEHSYDLDKLIEHAMNYTPKIQK